VHATLCDFVQDIALNAIEAASPTTVVRIAERGTEFDASVDDEGRGMDEAELEAARDPFVTAPGKHPSRSVGLGLSFLHQLVEQTGGRLDIASESGKGTSVRFVVPMDHLDCPPVGDVPGLAFSLMCYPGDYELVFFRTLVREGTRDYTVRRSELKEALGDLDSVTSLGLLKEFLRGEESSLFALEV
jgi:hypothetical protein